jgi:hypothetical protein
VQYQRRNRAIQELLTIMESLIEELAQAGHPVEQRLEERS